ncbi:MAG: ATP-dependent zinc metalloprotease FtsH [Verrucomicrobia bacterium]|nr:ATP-dependent zinc metalloprotease FtsH [Verrucomicrobiota bacterium]MCF7707472.1 ATP-dependent zinc metalloprotease FtsH [Verrucomicrobiota bacterium]
MNGRNDNTGRRKPSKDYRPQWRFPFAYFLIAFALILIWQAVFSHLTVKTIPYSEFKEHLRSNEVVECRVSKDEINGKIMTRPGDGGGSDAAVQSAEGAAEENEFMFRTVRVDDPDLTKQLEESNVKYIGVKPDYLMQFLFAWILPIGLIVLLWVLISKKMGSAGQSMLSFGKSKARLVPDKSTGVVFNDVAGCDEAKYELQEVVDFLQNPNRYKSVGAKTPKGVLLVGPPGTGKTLLARAVAGEAGVPFYSLSGSDFVEMFVGVGAARVRDLFQQAKGQAPCIIFIDELDAIGRQRGVHVGAVNDEREQTLNQLLAEMDGFAANIGIILLAATNRPDVLDRALLRPGRFDRQVVVDAPDIDGREAILKVHAREKPLSDEVDLRRIAQATPGFSGADLANALNEAALLAARRHAKAISQKDLEEAVEKVVAGPERKSRRLSEQEKQRVAFHEVGHALVSAYSKGCDPVHKISIVPRGRAALGYTYQMPADNQYLLTHSELLDRIRGMLGGRAAEQTQYGEVTTGAENDLERATILARQMVCLYGMSETLGLAHGGKPNTPTFLQGDGSFYRDFSDETAREVDKEVKVILEKAYLEAKEILEQHKDQLEKVTGELLRRETLDGPAFYSLIGRQMPKEAPAAAPPIS